MGDLVYYAGVSHDGFLAGQHGGVQWLEAAGEGGGDHGYADTCSTLTSTAVRSPSVIAMRRPSWGRCRVAVCPWWC